MDAAARPGPEAMAVDEWLWETAREPVLRVYRWSGNWGSIGCFGRLEEARAALPGLEWVRRWTGGGTVDHRRDWTYTLVVPAGEPLASMRGAQSYQVIHRALAVAMAREGRTAELAGLSSAAAGGLCFVKPVEHDLLDRDGRKLAGAGQRRNRAGLLHQGSVALPVADFNASAQRARRLAAALAGTFVENEFHPPPEDLRGRIARRYGNPEWTARR
jgi:lipoate-protein ligase A